MRCFIAIEIPDKIKDRLEKIQTNLRRAGIRASWVKRKAVHLTLVFLGKISPEQINQVAVILRNLSELPGSIEVKLSHLDAFPNLEYPKVAWIGLIGETERIKQLDSQIRNKLIKEKIPFDPKLFVPHLTLGRLRFKPRQRRRIAQTLSQFQLKERPKFEISQIALVESQLTSQGPIYTILETIKL
jgi:2'-5' RNA ligase